MIVRIALPALCLLLAACGEEKTPVAASAGGEVLEGSISDAMIPLDTVRSQPPLAPRPTESGSPRSSAEPDVEETQPEAPEAAPAAAEVRPDAE